MKTSLNYFNAKIVRIHSRRAQAVKIDTRDTLLSPVERPSLYHLLEMRLRRRGRLITTIMDHTGTTHTTQGNIMNTLVTSLREGYARIPVDRHCVELLCKAVEATKPDAWNERLEAPLTETDLWQGPPKSPLEMMEFQSNSINGGGKS